MSVWEGITESQLDGIIRMAGPDKDVHAGRNFLLALLYQGKKDQFISFIEKARKALSEEGSLDLSYDFTAAEQEIFKRAALNYMNRNEFLNVPGWFLPGASYFATGLLTLAGKLQAILYPEPTKPKSNPLDENAALEARIREIIEKIQQEKESAKPSLQAAAENVHAIAGAPMEMLIGAALMNEAKEKREAIKLEQISDAVSQVMEGVTKLAERILAEREAKAR